MAKTQKNKHKSRIRQRKSRRKMGSRMYKNYSDDMLKIACEAVVSNQISSRDAERQFGIPRRTIVNKIKNMHTKSVGHPTILTAAEEKKIVRVLQVSSDFGSPLSKLDLKLLVHEYLKKNSRDILFKNKIPGNAWVQGFLARHADELSLRTTQNISKARAEKGPQEIAHYFDNLSLTMKDIPAANIINFDETNLSDDPGSSKCIFRRGVRYPERIANSTKGNISLMFTATASGQCLPIYVVYKATNLYSEWISGGPPETRYNCTKSGWFDSAMFEDYFVKIILPWAQMTPGTKVVICDNLSSHLSVKVVELCEQNNIKFVFIPPRSTHLTQPLDVAFFAPLKKAWREILYKYKLKNPNQTSINKKHFPKLLIKLTEAIRLKEENNIRSGFRASGVFPLNPREILKKIPEMQEEVLTYRIDQALMDYLKETRAPKPMAVKRNKKINCEPAKSVTVSDLNIITYNDAPEANKKKKTRKNKSSGVIKLQRKNEHPIFLDEQTSLFTITNLDSNNVNENTFQSLDDNIYSFDNSIGIDIDIPNGCTPFNPTSIPETLILETPKSLNKYCIDMINSYLGQSVHNKLTLSTHAHDFLLLKESTSSSTYPLMAKNENKISVKARPPKINILSNVIIKAGTQSSDVCFLNEVSSKTENTPFIAMRNSDLPECLQKKETKVLKQNKKDNTGRNRKKINIKDKPDKDYKRKKSTQGHTSVKRRRKRFDSDSSSISLDSTIEIVTADSDDLEYKTMHDYYIDECLREQEEKENFDLTDIPFGLHDIEYFIKERTKLKENDWIIARFASKKSLKHFVGKVLSISDDQPTVKFVRKVKESKCDTGTTFTYPSVDDIYTQNLEDVISVLPEPMITRRGQIIFNVDFSNFNIQ